MSEGQIGYYVIDGVPGRYFACPRGVGKLSDKACAGLYTEAMSPKGLREGFHFRCRGCSVGAGHAGVDPHSGTGLRAKLVCVRCIRPATRLIRSKICVTCYNREREVLKGRNAKGNAPVRCRPIFAATIAYRAGSTINVKRCDRVASRSEAVLSVMRDEPHPIMFGWHGAAVEARA